MSCRRRLACAALLLAAATSTSAQGEREVRCGALALVEVRRDDPPTQYAAFCDEHPRDCDLSGDPVLDWTEETRRLLDRINREVNAEIELVSDWDCLGVEEHWSYPEGGYGDCEDFALEKRRRLVEAGLPGAALTMAIVHHEVQFFPHAILLAETSRGTWVLDNLHDEILCWDAVPYRYERRERPDGQWSWLGRP